MTRWRIDLARTASPSRIEGGPGCRCLLSVWTAEVRGRGGRIFLLADETVLSLWGDRLAGVFGDAGADAAALTFSLPPGEATKDVQHAAAAWDWLAAQGARRDDLVVALGGGVVGDLAGFVAATYLRGLAYWQVPTTLLAQVDSSVGGKVAINLPAGKNLVGAFYQAERVIIDPEFLSTLPDGEYAGGLGEVVKYGLLDKGTLLEDLERGSDRLASREIEFLSQVIQRCVALKALVVEQDERDKGPRAMLNLGHTAAHALETALGYGTLSHGAAVGLGLLVAIRVSEKAVGTDAALLPRVRTLLDTLGLPTSLRLPDVEELLRAASLDKKLTAAGRSFVCLRAPGDPAWGTDVSDADLREGFEVIRA